MNVDGEDEKDIEMNRSHESFGKGTGSRETCDTTNRRRVIDTPTIPTQVGSHYDPKKWIIRVNYRSGSEGSTVNQVYHFERKVLK